jgi:hypothetical protein
MTPPQITQESQKGKVIFQYPSRVLKAVAHVAVCTPNHPNCAINITTLIKKDEPRSPKAFVAHMVHGRPRSVPWIPVSTIMKEQIANPINAARATLARVIAAENMPPTISIGMQIIVPIHINAMLVQLCLSLSETWLRAFRSILSDFLVSIYIPPEIFYYTIGFVWVVRSRLGEIHFGRLL